MVTDEGELLFVPGAGSEVDQYYFSSEEPI
jgi:hypothetical protein